MSCHELDLVVEACAGAGALGARMIGGGFGGSVLVVADADDDDAVGSAAAAALASHGRPAPSVVRAVPSPGARRARLP